MAEDKMVSGQNGIGQNRIWTKWYQDKLVSGENGIRQNHIWTKWHWTKWYQCQMVWRKWNRD